MDLFVRKYGYQIDLEGFGLASNDLRNGFVWGAIGEFLNIKTILNKISLKRIKKVHQMLYKYQNVWKKYTIG